MPNEREITFDDELPHWKPVDGVVKKKDYSSKMYTEQDARRARAERAVTVVNQHGEQVRTVMPTIRYGRAIDLTGNLACVPVGTNHCGADTSAEINEKVDRKRAQGFLFIDLPPHIMGVSSEEERFEKWHTFCRLERKRRQKAHAERDAKAQALYAPKHELLIKALMDGNEEVMQAIGTELRSAFREMLSAFKAEAKGKGRNVASAP